jgi:putative ATP-dependent endonuclease of OLD family
MGIDYVGVGGYGNYLPFLRFSESLNIPWLILSDGEDKTIRSIKNALKKLNDIKEVDLSEHKNVFILDDGADFEKYLIDTNYIDVIKKTFISLYDENYLVDQIKKLDGTKEKRIKTNNTCASCKQSIYTDLLRDYTGDEGFKRALYDLMTSQKTKFAPVIAEQIVKSDKALPPKILELFGKIKSMLNITEEVS